MKKHLLHIAFIILTCNTYAQELRTAASFESKLSNKHYLNTSAEWRTSFENEMNHRMLIEFDYTYKWSKQYRLKLTNRYAFATNDWDNNNYRTTLDFSYRPDIEIGNGKLRNRFRLQHTYKDWDKSTYAIRNRIKYVVGLNKRTTPYSAVEFIYVVDGKQEDSNQIRLTLGSALELGDLKLDLYYKTEISSGYKTVLFNHVIGSVWEF